MARGKLSFGERMEFWSQSDKCPHCPKILKGLSLEKRMKHINGHVKKSVRKK